MSLRERERGLSEQFRSPIVWCLKSLTEDVEPKWRLLVLYGAASGIALGLGFLLGLVLGRDIQGPLFWGGMLAGWIVFGILTYRAATSLSGEISAAVPRVAFVAGAGEDEDKKAWSRFVAMAEEIAKSHSLGTLQLARKSGSAQTHVLLLTLEKYPFSAIAKECEWAIKSGMAEAKRPLTSDTIEQAIQTLVQAPALKGKKNRPAAEAAEVSDAQTL